MLCINKNDAPNTPEFEVFSDRTCFGIFSDEGECPSEFITEQVRSLGAVASPPMRLIADLASSIDGRFDLKCHRSIRFVEFGEEVVGVYELAAFSLPYRLEKQAFLFRRDAKCLTGRIAKDGNPLALCEGFALQNNCPVRHGARSDLHGGDSTVHEPSPPQSPISLCAFDMWPFERPGRRHTTKSVRTVDLHVHMYRTSCCRALLPGCYAIHATASPTFSKAFASLSGSFGRCKFPPVGFASA